MPLVELELDEQFQSSYMMRTVVPVNDPKSDVYVDEMLTYNGEKFFVTEVEGNREDSAGNITILAESSWMRLADIKRPGTYVLNMNPQDGLNNILFGTGWVAASVTDDTAIYNLETQDISVLDWLWQWAKVCGCEITFETSSKTLVFQTQVGATLAMGFRYGRNMKSIKRTVTPPKVTRLYAYGKSDETTIVTLSGGTEYIEDYSYYTGQGMTLDEARENYRKDDVFYDDSITDSATLYSVAQRRLAVLAQPIVKYEASVADLSRLTTYNENEYRIGDTVPVYDELLGIDISARVTRTVKYPDEPWRNKVELTFGGILMADTTASVTRSNRTKEWELFESHNRNTPRTIYSGNGILNRLALETVSGAEWVVGYSFYGVGVGTGTLIIESTNDGEFGGDLWPTHSMDFVDGQVLTWAWTYGEDEIPAANPIMVIRAHTTGGGTVDVPERGTALWVLARGTTQTTPTLTNSITYNCIGSVQTFTVPDGVTEILIEARGGQGRSAAGPGGGAQGGNGGKVTAKFAVSGGATYDVYVGCEGEVVGQPNGGWPNGGDGGLWTTRGGGGGGSSDVRPSGAATIASALIVAAGGGGAGAGSGGNNAEIGGHGGFRSGDNGNSDDVYGTAGEGASQVSFGANGVGLFLGGDGEDGDTDGLGHGGDAYTATAGTNGIGSGGGGGGWHGGGGGGSQNASGGGGSGWVNEDAYDLEYEDGENDATGVITISWDLPEDEA